MRLFCARTAILPAAVAAMLPLFAHAAPSDGDALLQRAAAASGQPWRYHIRSTIAAEDAQTAPTQIDEQGSRLITERCTGIVCDGTMIDTSLRKRWIFSYNGTPIEQTAMLDPQLVTVRAIVSYAFTSSEFRRDGGRVEAVPESRLAGRPVAPFDVTAPGGAKLTALLDPQTGLLSAIADGPHVLYEYREQKRFGPLMLPTEIRRTGGVVQRYEERSAVDDPLVVPTGPAVTFSAAAPATKLAGGAIPIFPCRIDNAQTRCLLDTGASGMAMSLDLADRLHLSTIGRIGLQGLGAVASGIVRAGELDLGTMRVGPALYAILPDVGGVGAEVIIGADVIAQAGVRLDFVQRTIRFERPGSQAIGNAVPLIFAGITPKVPIELATTRCELAVDTGDAASIDLSAAFAKAHPGLFVAREKRRILGVGGRGTQTIGTVDVAFADLTLRDVPVGATDVPGGHPTDRIGAGFLSRFILYLDYASGRMSVQTVR
ncbi:MAG: retropepsin-like aspartic protease [Vulcanimicrobiaceae bacterium]